MVHDTVSDHLEMSLDPQPSTGSDTVPTGFAEGAAMFLSAVYPDPTGPTSSAKSPNCMTWLSVSMEKRGAVGWLPAGASSRPAGSTTVSAGIDRSPAAEKPPIRIVDSFRSPTNR